MQSSITKKYNLVIYQKKSLSKNVSHEPKKCNTLSHSSQETPNKHLVLPT